MCEHGWNSSDGSRSALAVVEREGALSRRVVFKDLWDSKTVLKWDPYVFAESVAAGEAKFVRRFACL